MFARKLKIVGVYMLTKLVTSISLNKLLNRCSYYLKILIIIVRKRKMELLIGGDLVPTQSNFNLFREGDVKSLLGEELLRIWQMADERILNLETPLIDYNDPIKKAGPNLRAPVNTIEGIKKLNPSLITLANNHVLDHGVKGLISTEVTLNKNNIPYTGVGKNLLEASKPYIIKHHDLKIGIYACAEHEFNIATTGEAGTNPFDPLESFEHVKNLKMECDYVIVLYHGGKECYRYPSPNLQKICRKLAKTGADVVICQHSHCVGSVEEYENSTIVYGQGNFLFDRYDNEFWKTGIIVKINIDSKLSVDYIPIVKVGKTIKLADYEESKYILSGLEKRSNEIKEIEFVENTYKEFSREMLSNYLSGLHGDNLFFRILNKFSKRRYVKHLYSRKSLNLVRNILECEAHRELAIRGLRDDI